MPYNASSPDEGLAVDMSVLRGTRATSLFLATMLMVAYPVAADVVENDIASHNGNDTIGPGESLLVVYSITSTTNDKQDGCNAADGTPATLLIQPSSAAVTATPSSLTFTSCGAGQSVSLTSSVAGNYRINLEVQDGGAGSYATGGATFTLHVVDPTPADATAPIWTVPASAGGEATGPGGLAVSYVATVSDDTGVASSGCVPPSGSTFPVGSTTVTCTATDAAGNVGTATFTVTVTDTTAPSLSLPADITAEATGPSGAAVAYAASASDLVDGAVSISCSPPSGSTFPLGATTVSCSATDAAGNTATGSFTVTVEDTTGPSLSLPADMTVEATDSSGASATWTASASDLVDGAVSVDCVPPSGSTFPLGATTVTCTATDAAGNAASGSFTVTVQDTTAPILSLPAGLTLEATGPSGAEGTYTASALDAVDGPIAPGCSPASGSTFAMGATTVSCTATDAAGNSASGSFTVTVQDTTAPSLTLPSDVTLEATGPSGAAATWTASASDLVDGAVTPDCAPASGSTFPLGSTTVVCSATDGAGNSAGGSFTVTVQDTTPPTLTLPADMTLEATGPSGASATYAASASDLVDGSLAALCAPASGSTFAMGTTTVACSATDAAGNTATGSFTVTVQDTTPPSLALPADMTVEATGPSGAAATFSASASDLVDGALSVSCSPASGSTFPLGATTVSCSATDAAGNAASGSFTVTVRDTTAPALSLPASFSVEATGPSGASATYAASASDLVDGAMAASCAPASGSTFAMGATTVSCSATDAAGNTASGSFTITVVDTTPPTIAPHAAVSADATSGGGASVTYTVTASDLVDGPVTATCSPPSGSAFPLGTTTVTCNAMDAAGNAAAPMSFQVTVALNCLGPLSPIKLDGKTNFKLGSTIPIKCLPQGGSAGVGDATIRLTLRQVNTAAPTGDVIALSTSAADTGNVMRWDPTGQQYIYNLATKPLSKGTWEITMDMGGGATKVFRIGLR